LRGRQRGLRLRAGDSITLCLDDEIDVTRRNVIASASDPAELSDQFEAKVLCRFGNETDLPLHIILIDRQPAIGEGIAYRTTDGRHLLNVPARLMSAWPDLPEDFHAYARSKDPSVCPNDFLPRKIYGQYVRDARAGRSSW